MPSSKKAKPAARRPSRPPAKPKKAAPKPAPKKAAPAKSPAKPSGGAKKPAPAEESEPVPVPMVGRTDGRRHVLSLSFVRDGDEFLARLETDSGHITELKNRALDQLLTLVAGELEDLLE
jgi:hypothetical protein